MALVEVWVDPSAPDGGSGTYLSPWSNQDTAVALSHVTYPDLRINLKRGLIYKPQGTTIGGLWLQDKRPSGNWRIQSYGDAEMPPTFFSGTNMLPGDAGWSYIGSGLWKKTLNNNAKTDLQESMRLFVGGSRPIGPVINREMGTGYTYGTARARYALLGDVTDADVLAEVGTMGSTAARIWTYAAAAAGAVGTLYVWTGSATQDPPTYYDGITLVGANSATDATAFGRNHGIGLWGCSNVTVAQADSIFSPDALRAYGHNSDNSNAGFEQCSALAFGGNGLYLEGVSGFTASNFFARDTLVDAIATYDEDWNFRDKYSAPYIYWLNARQDAITVGRWMNACLLERVICRDGYHGNYYIGGQTSSGSGTTVGTRIIDCEASGQGRLYGGACVVTGLGVGNVAIFNRFIAHDLVSFIAVGGSGQSVLNDCLFYDAKRPYSRYDATSNNSGLNTIPAISVQPVSASWGDYEAGCLTMNRCTVMQPYGFMMNFNKDNLAGTTPAGVMVVNDSVFVDTRWLNDSAARTYIPGTYDKPGLSIEAVSSTPAGALVVTNSYYYTGAAGQARVSTANQSSGNKTFAAWSGLSGTFNEADPKVDLSGRLLAGSPLIGAGSSGAYGRDVCGRQRPNPPSIGAYDVATLRRRLTTDPAA